MRTVRRRRLEAKTDYKTRLALLMSGKPRLVVRKTNRYIIAQLVETTIAQDKILFGLTSHALMAKGWPKEYAGGLKNITAAYLTGYMLGKLAKGKIKEAVLDLGMHRAAPRSRIYAVVKGVIDAGITIPHNPSILPLKESIESNKKVKEVLTKLQT